MEGADTAIFYQHLDYDGGEDDDEADADDLVHNDGDDENVDLPRLSWGNIRSKAT